MTKVKSCNHNVGMGCWGKIKCLSQLEHEMMIPKVTIPMILNEYSKQYGPQNVTGLPNILAKFCGHYFSASGCKFNQNETYYEE